MRLGCGLGRALRVGRRSLARGRKTDGRWQHPHLPRLERDSLAVSTSAAISLAHANPIVPLTPTLGPQTFLKRKTLLRGHSTDDLPAAHILAGSPHLPGLVIWSTFECPSAETAPCYQRTMHLCVPEALGSGESHTAGRVQRASNRYSLRLPDTGPVLGDTE